MESIDNYLNGSPVLSAFIIALTIIPVWFFYKWLLKSVPKDPVYTYSEKVDILVNAMMNTDSTREAVQEAQGKGVGLNCMEDMEAFKEAVERAIKQNKPMLSCRQDMEG